MFPKAKKQGGEIELCTKLLLSLALVLCGGLLGCSTASRHAATRLDLASYRIDQANKAARPFYEPGTVVTQWQNVLVFSNSSIRVSLARSATTQASFDSRFGFDPASLKLRWLKQDELLLISWTTLSRGSGSYTHDGNVIVQIQGEHGSELFRDCFMSYASGGWGAKDRVSLDISYNDSDRLLRLTRHRLAINGDMGAPDSGHPFPFTRTFTNDDGEAGYVSVVCTVNTWHYQMEGSKLTCLRGSAALDLGDEAQPIEAIVKDSHITRSELERMNPDIRDRQETAGRVILDDKLKPYEVSSYDGLWGSRGFP
jgi:hypothetical protein